MLIAEPADNRRLEQRPTTDVLAGAHYFLLFHRGIAPFAAFPALLSIRNLSPPYSLFIIPPDQEHS
jgi:hypothetical protein